MIGSKKGRSGHNRIAALHDHEPGRFKAVHMLRWHGADNGVAAAVAQATGLGFGLDITDQGAPALAMRQRRAGRTGGKHIGDQLVAVNLRRRERNPVRRRGLGKIRNLPPRPPGRSFRSISCAKRHSLELQQMVQTELDQNPALESVESILCMRCGAGVTGRFCPVCAQPVYPADLSDCAPGMEGPRCTVYDDFEFDDL